MAGRQGFAMPYCVDFALIFTHHFLRFEDGFALAEPKAFKLVMSHAFGKGDRGVNVVETWK